MCYYIVYHIFGEISMPKKLFLIFLTVLTVFLSFCIPFSASAYEVTEFEVHAKAGMLASLDTDEILFEKNIDQKIYPASITKIMTGIIILESEKYDPDAKISMTQEILDMVLGTGLSVSLMKAGEEFTQYDLLHLVTVASYGDSTYLAAQYYGGTIENFVKLMNDKAKELGLTATNFTNPVGLHEDNHYTTVRDIFTLTKYALKNEKFREVCDKSRYSFTTSLNSKRTLSTTNFLIDSTTNYYYSAAHGIKTGFTDEAGRCLVSVAYPEDKEYSYICILMGCPDKASERYQFSDSTRLYRWAFNNFSYKEIAKSTEPVCEMPLELSLETDFVPLYFKEPFLSILPNGADDSTIVIKPKLNSESYEAPVKKGQVLGTAEVYYAEKLIGTVDLVSGSNIEASGILVIGKYIKGFFTSVYMKIFLLVVILAVIIFIIMCITMNLSKFKSRRKKYIPYNRKEK